MKSTTTSTAAGATVCTPVRRCVAVAFSGGRDSVALLHATCRAALTLAGPVVDERPARPAAGPGHPASQTDPAAGPPIEVVAIHVHHGLLAEADDWLHRASALVARWRRRGWPVRLAEVRLAGGPAPGDSVEAWARVGRHAALARLAREAGASLLLLAHHRRDQAETVLLQALRGGGPAGLAAMPRQSERDGLTWARPWLDQPREAIEAYVRRHRLQPVDDPSNHDPRYARSRLRQAVWPAFSAAFPELEAALAAVARRAQEADAALAELAALDLAGCTDADGRLAVADWRRLSPARQANALRAWWWRRADRGAPETLVRRLLQELPPGAPSGPDAPSAPATRSRRRWPPVDGLAAVCDGLWLDLQVSGDAGTAATTTTTITATAAAVATTATATAAQRLPAPGACLLDLSRSGVYPLPAWGGQLLVEPCEAGGLPVELLRGVRLRSRQGGEQFQLGPGRPPRRLKKQYQALGLADGPGRAGPLLWHGDRLLYVPGLGIDARVRAAPGVPQRALHWQADPLSLPGPGPSAPHKPAD